MECSAYEIKISRLASISVDCDLDEEIVPDEDYLQDVLDYELPSVFTRDFNYGLGFLKEYRFIVKVLEELGVEHLYISRSLPTTIIPKQQEATISISDSEKIRKALNSITQKAQRISTKLKSDTAYQLVSDLLLLQISIIGNADASSEIVKYLGKSKRFQSSGATGKETEDALEVISNNSQKIIKDHPEKLANTWEKHVLKAFSVGFDATENPIREGANDNSIKIYYHIDEDYFPVQTMGDWLKVKWGDIDKERYGWIKWRADHKLLIDIFYKS